MSEDRIKTDTRWTFYVWCQDPWLSEELEDSTRGHSRCWIFQECRRSKVKLSAELPAANWTGCKRNQGRNCLRYQAAGKTKCINSSPLPSHPNFARIRTGKNRLTETAAAPKVGVETIGKMPSPSSCDSWLVSVPGGGKISNVDPLHLSTAIPHFSVAGRNSPIPSVILGGLTVSFAWAVEKSCAGSRIKCKMLIVVNEE